MTRRQAEGKNRKEIIRCLKRHIAREIYRLLANPGLRPPTQPPSESRYHHQPGRPSPPNPHRPHLRTRARPRPQSPTRHSIPEVAPHPRTGPITDLTTVGASPPCDGKYQTLSGALSKLLTVSFGGEERSPAPDVGTGGIRGSTRFEEAGMVDLGYCPPCGKRPQNSACSPVW